MHRLVSGRYNPREVDNPRREEGMYMFVCFNQKTPNHKIKHKKHSYRREGDYKQKYRMASEIYNPHAVSNQHSAR